MVEMMDGLKDKKLVGKKVELMADKLVDLKDRSSVALMEEMLVDATDFQMV